MSHLAVPRAIESRDRLGDGDVDDDDDRDRSLLSHLAHSLIPQEFHHHRDEGMTKASSKSSSDGSNRSAAIIPTKRMLRRFSSWCFRFLNEAGDRRRAALRRNVAQGAAVTTATCASYGESSIRWRGGGRRRRSSPGDDDIVARGRSGRSQKGVGLLPSASNEQCDGTDSALHSAQTKRFVALNDDRYPNERTDFHTTAVDRLIRTLTCLSPQYDEDPQLYEGGESGGEVSDAIDAVERITGHEKTLLFLVMLRSLGWRARYVESLNPMPLELTVDHPLLQASYVSYTPNNNKRSKSLSSASLDNKPPAARGNSDDFEFNERLHNFFRFAAGTAGRNKRRKSQKNDATAKASSVHAVVDLVSDGDDDEALSAGGREDIERPSKRSSNSLPASSHEKENVDFDPLLSWVEVLCHGDDGAGDERVATPPAKSTKRVAMWVPIEVERECFDKPEDFESILAWTGSRRAGKPDHGRATTGSGDARKDGIGGGRSMSSPKSVRQWHRAIAHAKKSPVSYVLAVEHYLPREQDESEPGGRSLRGARFTDVTPRYASAWSRTLRLRGASSGREIVAGRGKCVDEWWRSSLKRANVHCRGRSDRNRVATATIASKTSAAVRSVTKVKTIAGKEVEVIEFESSNEDDDRNAAQLDCSDSDEDRERMEAKYLAGSMEKEKIPTSKAQFKQSPFYVIPSVLNSRDVLHPDACKNVCGVFKGELVYRRSDVSKALMATKWLYRGRKVKASELGNPAKQIKARKKAAAKGFQALSTYGVSEKAQRDMISSMNLKGGEEDDSMDDLYGEWQTEPWSPPYVGPEDAIPTNNYRNVEKALINPGLTHMDRTGLAPIARKLGIPYAPCMLGYDGHGGNRTATIRGIVVHDHNVALMREASVEWESHALEVENRERRDAILRRWKRLVVGMLTKERLDREYG
ncbi:hypothetical protein ACHAW5_002638 [Stephanodiscus triporus]|uniref:Uncharacterized protein n=1 Tax=Stephanodiscus triporus TaxID=2934178 RepID=A0ABD3NP81_9STRA